MAKQKGTGRRPGVATLDVSDVRAKAFGQARKAFLDSASQPSLRSLASRFGVDRGALGRICTAEDWERARRVAWGRLRLERYTEILREDQATCERAARRLQVLLSRKHPDPRQLYFAAVDARSGTSCLEGSIAWLAWQKADLEEATTGRRVLDHEACGPVAALGWSRSTRWTGSRR